MSKLTRVESNSLHFLGKTIACVFSMVLIAAPSEPTIAQQQQVQLVRPIEGSRMIVGNGEVAAYTVDCFLHLCRTGNPTIAIIDLDGKSRVPPTHWKQHGAKSVQLINAIAQDREALTLQLLNVDGVWIEGDIQPLIQQPLLRSLIANTAKRGGVIAVDSSSASLLAHLDDHDARKRIQSPFAACEFHFQNKPLAHSAGEKSNQKVHWSIPDHSVLVVHRGRRIAGYGHEDITVKVKAANGWPVRQGTFECIDVFGPGGYPAYSLDLLSWVRSAHERGRVRFPAKDKKASTTLKKGTLFLHGGSQLHDDVLQEFVRLAGGKGASFVCIPSASRFDPFEEVNSYCAGRLNEMGCNNVAILHTDDPLVANQNERFAELLKRADAVWIDGGRTYRFMDSYENTNVADQLQQVLDRGGVVGGSSAGCQVPSDFLVRGNPRSNRDIVHGGYTRGLGLLKGAIIDAHFLQRGRHEPFLGLMKQHPQMLGIGIDESTALIVQGDRGQVVGKAAVSFYDLQKKGDDFRPVILKSGESFNLQSRQVIRD